MGKKAEIMIEPGFADALTVLFIALKLCGVIHWSWFWVISPIWITLFISIFLAILIFLFGSN